MRRTAIFKNLPHYREGKMRKIIGLSFLMVLVAILTQANNVVNPLKIVAPPPPMSVSETTGPFIWHIDTPQFRDTVSGIVVVEGWILSEIGVSRIDFYVDKAGGEWQYVSTANINIPRDDVIEIYPQYAGTASAKPGFTVGFLAADYADGPHYIHLVATDANGNSASFGDRSLWVDNTVNPGPRGYLESPKPNDTLNGPFPVYGWAVDENGIDRIEALIDGLVIEGAVLGGPRPDIYYAFPMFPQAALSGYIVYLDSNRVENGLHTLTVRAFDPLGQSRVLGERQVFISNEPANDPPFGFIEWPLRDIMMEGQCDDTCGSIDGTSPPDNTCPHPLNLIHGWALDTAPRADQGSVAYVELLVDGALFFNTRTDCKYNNTLKSYVDCYGMTRFDIQNLYPGYVNTPECGWRFWLDVGYLIAHMGYVEGAHYISARVGDVEDTVTIIDQIPVFFKCVYRVQGGTQLAASGYIDVPSPYQYVTGSVRIAGWAIDYNKVCAIEVYVDGIYQGDALYGDLRQDVHDTWDWSFWGLYSGWHFDLDTTPLNDGEHDLVIQVRDCTGDLRILGERRFVSDNNPSNP
jgi:hypothetical protein